MPIHAPREDSPKPSLRDNLRAYLRLINRFLRPSWRVILIMVIANLAATTLLSLRFLALTPALETVLENNQPPATGLTDLTVNNLGPTMLAVLGIDASEKFNVVVVAAGLFLVIHLLVGVFDVIGYWLLLVVRNRVRQDMTVWLHQHLIRLPLSFFLRNTTGDLTSRATADVNATCTSLDTATKALLQSLFQVILYVTILLRTDAMLTSLILVLGLFHLLVARILSPVVYHHGKKIQQQTGLMAQTVMESYQGIRLIKSFAAERFDLERIRRTVTRVSRAFTRSRFIIHLEYPVRLAIDGMVVAILVVATFRYAVVSEHLQLSAFAIFIGLTMQLITPISQLSSKFILLNSLMGGASRIQDIMSTQDSLPDGKQKVFQLERAIEFRNTTFEYISGIPVLQDVNLTIEKGQVVAIVGPSGAGKSTLTDLLLRLQDPTAGQVLYDGVDIREFTQRSYRRMFGVVAQESLLMNGTVGYNIAFGRPLEEERLWAAARIANAEEFIREFSEGMDTPVGDRGIRLSGGQRQRIAIARAVYAEPRLLVLDEATSSLDAESEREVQTAIANVTRSITSVVVAHRLATILHADKVVVMDGGKIVASGTHHELLDSCPLYRRLYELQFARPPQQPVV